MPRKSLVLSIPVRELVDSARGCETGASDVYLSTEPHMMGMILAAGLGTRLLPLTRRLPKALMPVGLRPLLLRHLENMASIGVDEVVVNLHHHADHIRAAVADGYRGGTKVRFHHEPALLGTGGAVAAIKSLVDDEPVLVINADLWAEFDLASLLDWHSRASRPASMLVQPHHDDSAFVGVRDGCVTWVPEMPSANDVTPWTYVGALVVDGKAIADFSDEPGCILRGPIRALIENGTPPSAYAPPQARWVDVGTPAGLLEANLWALGSDRPLVSPTAVVAPSARLGQVVVGDGGVVGADCVLDKCVVLPGSVVAAGARLDRAIVGPDAIVEVHREPRR